jgi:hypothetical protein
MLESFVCTTAWTARNHNGLGADSLGHDDDFDAVLMRPVDPFAQVLVLTDALDGNLDSFASSTRLTTTWVCHVRHMQVQTKFAADRPLLSWTKAPIDTTVGAAWPVSNRESRLRPEASLRRNMWSQHKFSGRKDDCWLICSSEKPGMCRVGGQILLPHNLPLLHPEGKCGPSVGSPEWRASGDDGKELLQLCKAFRSTMPRLTRRGAPFGDPAAVGTDAVGWPIRLPSSADGGCHYPPDWTWLLQSKRGKQMVAQHGHTSSGPAGEETQGMKEKPLLTSAGWRILFKALLLNMETGLDCTKLMLAGRYRLRHQVLCLWRGFLFLFAEVVGLLLVARSCSSSSDGCPAEAQFGVTCT